MADIKKQEKDAKFWRDQINSAKSEHKSYFDDAKNANEAYSAEKDYNIFYSNVNVLSAALMNNKPKPDIQRRFLKKSEKDKLRYNTYLEVAKIAEGCISYYSDVTKLVNKEKESVRASVKGGRGVTWVEYTPVISLDANHEESVTDRKLEVINLRFDEYLQSSAKCWEDCWWVARQHTLSSQDLQEKFDYTPMEYELSLGKEDSDDTSLKRAEVWEIWDKSEKVRQFVIQGSQKNRFLKSTKDPYKLEGFFPLAKPIYWLTNGENIIPIAEYTIYKKQAKRLDSITRRSGNIEENAIKLVTLTMNQDKDKAAEIAKSKDGDLVSLDPVNPETAKVDDYIGSVPVDGALRIVDHIAIKKEEYKNDIFDVTGISDLLRGQTDPRETAKAQQIKGFFGSLRFNDRQSVIQEHIKDTFSIMTEIICEHWDEETLSEITCTFLPTDQEKGALETKDALYEAFTQSPEAQAEAKAGNIPTPEPLTSEEEQLLVTPTWEEVLEIMRDDKLRNYTIDIESSATIFDDKEAQALSIQRLMDSYLSIANNAVTIAQASPELVKGFIPIARLQLSSIKASRAVIMQVEEALMSAYNALIEKDNQPAPPNPEMLKLGLVRDKQNADIQSQQAKDQTELTKAQNESRQIALEEGKVARQLELDNKELLEKTAVDNANISNDSRELDIKQQEADRKDDELEVQTGLKVAEIQSGVDINTNIPGDVATFE